VSDRVLIEVCGGVNIIRRGDRPIADPAWLVQAKGQGLASMPGWVKAGDEYPELSGRALCASKRPHTTGDKDLLPSGLLEPANVVVE